MTGTKKEAAIKELTSYRSRALGIIHALKHGPGADRFCSADPSATEWFATVDYYLLKLLGSASPLYVRFKSEESASRIVCEQLTGAQAILIAVERAIVEGQIDLSEGTSLPLPVTEQICERFYSVACALRDRGRSRQPLLMADEYDVQYLLHALLRSQFDDVRPEEWAPSYAGGSARMDFLLKREQIVVEVKKTRVGLKAPDLGAELLVDIARYSSHPDCKTLVCFVFDPEGIIGNARGVEADLEKHGKTSGLPVRVFIRPK